MRRRRKTKYTWLPNIGQDVPVGDPEVLWTMAPFTSNLAIPRDQSTAQYIFPVVADDPNEEEYGINDHMGTIIGNEYFLKRIVGKLFIQMGQDPSPYSVGPPVAAHSPPGCIVAAGFFVSRAASDKETVQDDYPIGLTATDGIANFDNYSPLARSTVREPWIWRRSWMLGNNLDNFKTSPPNVVRTGEAWLPPNNSFYGSVLDGPHIDAKTARRIRQDERLFFCITANRVLAASAQAPDVADGILSFTLDVRYLGALRKAKNRGAF